MLSAFKSGWQIHNGVGGSVYAEGSFVFCLHLRNGGELTTPAGGPSTAPPSAPTSCLSSAYDTMVVFSPAPCFPVKLRLPSARPVGGSCRAGAEQGRAGRGGARARGCPHLPPGRSPAVEMELRAMAAKSCPRLRGWCRGPPARWRLGRTPQKAFHTVPSEEPKSTVPTPCGGGVISRRGWVSGSTTPL